MSGATARTPAHALDIERIRADFPILNQDINSHPLVFLDNAASSQKPRSVIDAISSYYQRDHANVHRGVHTLSQRATDAYEAARSKLAGFLGATSDKEVVFTRGTTEAINLVAYSFVEPRVGKGDEILITTMEHHSNIVPWQLLCERTGAVLKVAPINDDGEIKLDEMFAMIGPRTKFVSVVHLSNALGTINPVRRIADAAHAAGAFVLVDGAQSAPRMRINVAALGADFFALSGHKTYAPTGIGVLWGKAELFDEMRPYQGGGEMILSVTFEKTVFNEVPAKFEAGTPHIAGAIGFGAAVDYIESIGIDAIEAHEHDLLLYAADRLPEIAGLRIIGCAREKAGVHSFVLDGIHPHDVGTILDNEGVAIRTGHHCAQPVMQRFGIAATVRASFGLYNTRAEVDRLVAGLGKVREIFG